MFTAIFTVLLITAIGAGMIMLTNTDTGISANFRDEQKAFFAAKAGLEEVRDRFRTTATNSLATSLPTNLPGSANAFIYVLNPKNSEADTPWVTNGTAYPDTEVCTEMARMGTGYACSGTPAVPPGGSTWYTSTTASSAYAMSPVSSWKWTRINLKTNLTASGSTAVSSVDGVATNLNQRVCWTGATQVTTTLASCSLLNPNYLPVYVMTTLAVTPSGSRRMVQAEAVQTIFPTLPGPLVFDGGNPLLVPALNFSAPSSNAFTVSGMDTDQGSTAGAGCPVASNAAALGGTSATAVTTLTNDANGRPASYTGAPGTGSPSVANVSTALGTLATVGGLESLVSSVELVAGNEGNVYTSSNPPGGIAHPGTIANPQVNVVEGDITLSGNWTGAGILLVTGTLTFQGTPNYNGLILVIGKGNVIKNGGGNGTMDGSMLIANLYDSSGNLLPTTAAPGIPTMSWNGGGTVNFNYDSCWSKSMNGSLAYRIVAVRELIN